MKRIVPYLIAVPLGIATLLCTKGPDGNLIALLVAFSIIGLLYSIVLVATTTQAFTWHSVGHLVLFELVVGATLGRDLDEMAGMLYIFAPFGVGIFVVCGVIALFVVSRLRKKTC